MLESPSPDRYQLPTTKSKMEKSFHKGRRECKIMIRGYNTEDARVPGPGTYMKELIKVPKPEPECQGVGFNASIGLS